MSCVGNSHAGGAGHVKGAGALALRLLLASWLVVGSMVGVRAEESPAHPASKFDPTSAYREQRIEGWRILVNERLLSETNLGAPIYGTPVIANGTMYVMSQTHLYAVGADAKPVGTDAPAGIQIKP